jgi:hypothetical protein
VPLPNCKYGRHPDRSPHSHNQTVAVLSWLWGMREEASLATLAHLSLLHWTSAARSLQCLPGRLSGTSRIFSLVCEASVRRLLGRLGAQPEGSTRISSPTRECGAASASLPGHVPSRSASDRSVRTHPSKSHQPCPYSAEWKRSGTARNLRCFNPERSQKGASVLKNAHTLDTQGGVRTRHTLQTSLNTPGRVRSLSAENCSPAPLLVASSSPLAAQRALSTVARNVARTPVRRVLRLPWSQAGRLAAARGRGGWWQQRGVSPRRPPEGRSSVR